MSVPARKPIKDLFEGLLGRDVTLGDAPPVTLDRVPPPMVAVYVDDQLKLATVTVMDFALTAYVGAALGLVPKGGAEAAIEDAVLPQSLIENAAELLNVLAAPIGEASGTHQRLYKTYPPGEIPPADVAGLTALLGSREDVLLDVKGYGAGPMSVIAAP
jgi:hypothetical protein